MMTRDEEILLTSYREQAEALGIAAGSLRSRNATLQSQLDHAQGRLSTLERTLEMVRGERDRLQAVNGSLLRGGINTESDVAISQIAQYRTRAEQAETRRLAYQHANDALSLETRDLREALRSNESQREHMAGTVLGLREELAAAQVTIAARDEAEREAAKRAAKAVKRRKAKRLKARGRR